MITKEETFFLALIKEHTSSTDKTERSSHRKCPLRKGILSNFAKLTRKHLRQNIFLNKVAG